jgi:hypothetical protein
MIRLSAAASILLATACITETPTPTDDDPVSVPLPRNGDPDGSNCAPAPPTGYDSSGALRPFQSLLSHYYRVLAIDRNEVGDRVAIDVRLPAPYQGVPAYAAWEAKSVEIFQPKREIGFADHLWYKGIFGFGPDLGDPRGQVCEPTLDERLRLTMLAAHAALAQASACSENSDSTVRFWEVGPLYLLEAGEILDARTLIDRGLAMWTTEEYPERCIVPDRWPRPPVLIPETTVDTARHKIPCVIAFRPDAVTEAVVENLPSGAVVDGVPLLVRPFTAAGFIGMPNGLAAARNVLRSATMRAMAAVDVPVYEVLSPDPTNYWVRMIGHPVGPLINPSPLLLPEERAAVDGRVGLYTPQCCHEVCETTFARVAPGGPPPPPITTCRTVCTPEGQCRTAMSEGLTVMVSGRTVKSCTEDCPHPADEQPEAPVCEGSGGPQLPEQW